MPEPGQIGGERERGRDIARNGPVERGPQIVMLGLQAIEPDQLLAAAQLRRRAVRDGEEMGRVPLAGGVGLRGGFELLQPKLADRLQHHEARLVIRPVRLPQQAVLDQPFQAVADIEVAVRVGHRLGRLERGSPRRRPPAAGTAPAPPAPAGRGSRRWCRAGSAAGPGRRARRR